MTPQSLGPYEAGDAVEFEVDCVHEDGSVADLTSVTPKVYLAKADSLTAVASTENPLNNIDARVLDPATGGVVSVKIDSDTTLDFRGTYKYTVTVTDVLNQESEVAYGYVDFNARIHV